MDLTNIFLTLTLTLTCCPQTSTGDKADLDLVFADYYDVFTEPRRFSQDDLGKSALNGKHGLDPGQLRDAARCQADLLLVYTQTQNQKQWAMQVDFVFNFGINQSDKFDIRIGPKVGQICNKSSSISRRGVSHFLGFFS